MLGLGAAALVIGVLVLAPVIAGRALNVLAAVFVAALKPLGRLARGKGPPSRCLGSPSP